MRHAIALLLVALAALAEAPERLPVRCLHVGEGETSGGMVSVLGGKLTLAQDGEAKELPLGQFREILFPEKPPLAVPPPFTIWLEEGGRLSARAIRAGKAPAAVDVSGYGWEGENVPLASLRALAAGHFLAGAPAADQEEFQRLRGEPPVGFDWLSVAGEARHGTISCAVEEVSADGLRVALAGAKRTIPLSAVRWIVFSPAPGVRQEERTHVIGLADGTRIPADSLELTNGMLTAQRHEARYTVQAGRLQRIQVASDAYVYLSDLEPESVERQPFLDIVWGPRFDRSAAGGPLVLDGKTYAKGIGMHVRTEMTFAIDGRYSRFHATIGVDDAGGALGRVVFGVLADGRPVFQSKPVGGPDPARTLALDVTGARRLTLVADFGSPVEASGNLADWAEARLVK